MKIIECIKPHTDRLICDPFALNGGNIRIINNQRRKITVTIEVEQESKVEVWQWAYQAGNDPAVHITEAKYADAGEVRQAWIKNHAPQHEDRRILGPVYLTAEYRDASNS